MAEASPTYQLILEHLDDSGKFAQALSKYISKGDIICLEGTLGAGKTTFSQMLINAYMEENMGVTSPTFTLIQQYEKEGKTPIWHCDFYRLENESELIELGLDDAFDHAITLIEWPEIAYNDLPATRLTLKFSLYFDAQTDITKRIVHFNTDTPLGKQLQQDIQQW